ncbi:MAG: hypothetical protein AB1Z98_10595 [Nannocystaceae bacterium]
MKRVPALLAEPIGLAQWRAEHPADDHAAGDDATDVWERFRSSGDAYQQLLQDLLQRQQGLCGYCEQRLTKDGGDPVHADYQVEHVQAKSAAAGLALDWNNLMACCGGGT